MHESTLKTLDPSFLFHAAKILIYVNPDQDI